MFPGVALSARQAVVFYRSSDRASSCSKLAFPRQIFKVEVWQEIFGLFARGVDQSKTSQLETFFVSSARYFPSSHNTRFLFFAVLFCIFTVFFFYSTRTPCTASPPCFFLFLYIYIILAYAIITTATSFGEQEDLAEEKQERGRVLYIFFSLFYSLVKKKPRREEEEAQKGEQFFSIQRNQFFQQ